MSDQLSELGLMSELQTLMALKKRYEPLLDAANNAKKAWEENNNSIRDCETKLAKHTQSTARPEIVIVDGVAAFIPVPNSTGLINIQFTHPKGLPK